ncbi:MAG TPA: lamin tail domain-containing protein [Verrucomicrobiae bacterium]
MLGLAWAAALVTVPQRVCAQLPTGWTNRDIGLPGVSGSASSTAGNWTVSGGGSDIWGTFDSFHFAYRKSTNNAVILGRINSLDPTDPWTKGGVMFRHDADPSATFAMVGATPENGIIFQWRNSYGGDAASSSVSGIYPPVWLKLVRATTSFSGFYSLDGTAWTPIGPSQIVPMTNQPLAGLAVTAHNDALLATATFSSVVVSNAPGSPPAAPTVFGVYRQLWTGIGGDLFSLTNNVNWPDSPNAAYTKVFTNFETEVDMRDNYGQRLRAFVVPPTNGNYVFWIASDDNSELYLGAGEYADTNVTRVALVPGWTASREWTKYPEQQSAPIYLESGRRYYVEARMAEGSGGDNLAVRWQLPDGTLEEPMTAASVAGTRLVPCDGVALRPGIYQQSTNLTLVEGQSARLSVLVTNRSPVGYQWSLGASVLPGATNPVYAISNVTVALNNGQIYRCVVSNSAGLNTNTPITLAVVPDTTPPTVVRIANIGTTSVQVFYSEPVEAASATSTGNYVFTDGLGVTRAVLAADNSSVTLTTPPLVYGSNYTVVISGVRDRAPVPNTIAANTLASFTALPYSPVAIGNPPNAATVMMAGNGVDVSGSGNDIGGTVDQFGFGFTVRSGDFDVAARLAGLSLADVWAKAGLMARETWEASSRFAAVFATPAINGCFFEARSAAAAGSATTGNFPINYPYTWLRLKRSGNTFTGYAGYDGSNWMQLGSAVISLPAQIYFGLAVSSHNAALAATGQFRDILDVTNAVVGTVSSPHEPPGVSSRKTPIVITEIMYKPAARTDTNNVEFIEIYNSNPWFHDIGGYQLAGDNLAYTFPAGTRIPGGGYLVVAASPQSMLNVYGLANAMGPYTGSLKNPDTLKLLDEQGAVLLSIPYNDEYPWPVAASGTGHSLVLANRTYGEADGRAWDVSDAVGGSPGRMDPYRPSPLRSVVINEFLAHTDPPDWDYIELYNHANQPVDISGCILTDNAATNKFVIPPGTIIPARGFAWFTEPNLHFALSAAGETIYFRSADQTRFLDAVHFGGQENGVATGRWPDGANDWYRLSAKTPGTNNASIRLSQVVINELMYHPISGDDDDQYVELFNRGATPVNLAGWVLGDGIDFTFPSNTVIAADNYLVVARNATRLRTNYANLNPNNCLGDFTGRLAHNGERVTLRMPDTILDTNSLGVVTTNLIHITVNDVTYGNGGRWGEWSDGGGSSLEVINPNNNNRLAANWGDSDETQKAAWATVEASGVLDNGNNYGFASTIDYAQLGLLDPGECLVDDVEVLPDGWGANVVANPGFEGGLGDWSLQGCFARSFLDSPGYGGSLRALHVRGSSRLFTGANSCQMALTSNPLGDGSAATIRFKARWLRGWPEVLLRLNGNWLEASSRLPVPANLGTPGARNSRFFGNAGPAIYEVTHSPTVPAALQPVVVTAKAQAAGGLRNMQVYYRVDPAIAYTPVQMKDDGSGGDAIANDGVYSAIIPGQFDGSIVAFYVGATDAGLGVARFPALRNDGAPDPECVVRFGDEEPGGSFAVYHLWITATNVARWSELSDLSNEEHDCTMVCGSRVIYNVKARWAGSPYHQGFDTPDGALCHYKWTFPTDDKFLGATSFNKLHQPGNGAGDDGSIQREQLANTFLRTLGVPWLNRRHVVVYVNGNRRGTLMEDAQTPDNDVVEQYFPNDQDGWLYKMQPWFEFGPFPEGISIPFDNKSWCNLMPYTTTGGEKKTARYRYMFLVRRTPASANDYTNVFSLVDAASSFGTPNYVANMERLADMENWMRVFAANHAAGNWDAFGAQNSQNLYGYMGTQGTRYSLLMFDFNIVIGNSGSWGPGQNLFVVNDQDANTKNIYNEPTFRRMYWRALQELVNGPLNPTVSEPLLDAKYSAFVMNGLNVENPNAAIKTWLGQARDSIAVQLGSVNAAGFALNSAYTLSNNVAFLTGTAPVNIRSIWVNGAEYPLRWTSLTGFRVAVPLQPGTNTLSVVGVDAHNQPFPGASNTLTAVFSGTVPSPAGQVVFNEICYQPPLPGAQYVELFNKSTTATYDLSNWRLQGLAYTFPPGAAIGPQSYLVLAANAAAFSAAYGVSTPLFDTFGGVLQTDGETLTLIKPGTNTQADLVVDKIRYGSAAPWPAAANTPGTSLQLVDLAQDTWRVGNWAGATTNMTVEPQWLYATRSGNANSSTLTIWLESAGDIYLDDMKLVSGNVAEAGPNLLANGSFETAFPGPWNVTPNVANSALNTTVKHGGAASLHLACAAAGSGQSSSLWQTITPALVLNQPYTLSFWYLQSPNGGPLTVRVGSGIALSINPAPATVTRAVATPAAANSVAATLPAFPPLWINEIQADNLTGITNRAGQRAPWIEVFNPTANPVPLNGVYLANNFTNPMQWPFPANAVINPREFKVIFADGQTALSTATELHTSFQLSSGAGVLALTRQTTNAQLHVLDYLSYTNLTPNHSFGSFPDAQVFERQEFYFVTPAATNIGSPEPITVRINEWMASNTNTILDPVTGKYADWFELYNYGTNAANLDGFYLSDTITNADKFRIPPGYIIPPHGFLLVWADNKETNGTPDLHVTFKMDKTGEALGLFGASGQPIDYVTYGPQVENVSMGRYPDGGAAINSMVVPTPRTNNIYNTAPVLAPIADRTVYPGQTVSVFAEAHDYDVPAQTLTYSLGPGAPAGASINPSTGQFTWTTPPGSSTNQVTIVVSDNGVPNLSASQTFIIIVNIAPALTGVGLSGNQFSFGFATAVGRTYQVEYSDTLAPAGWLALGSPILGTGDVVPITVDIRLSAHRFYRVRVTQ